MKRLLCPAICLFLLGSLPGKLQAGYDGPYLIENPCLVYDCTMTGSFKYSQVMDDLKGFEGDQDCLYGLGLMTKVNLKGFYVQGVLENSYSTFNEESAEPGLYQEGPVNCAVRIIYGDCKTSEGTQKYYWFDSDGYYEPDFCYIYPDECLNQIDSVCDGITLNKKTGEMAMKMSKGGGYMLGKKFYRNLFQYTDNFNDCEYLVTSEEGESLGESSPREVTAIDLAGALAKCTISTTAVPTKDPFKYLNFCYEQEEPKRKLSAYICAPKSLCGPFFSYWVCLDGVSAYPNPEDICINNDLSLEGRNCDYYSGYTFASIDACAKYRLNTNLTACANLLEDVCDDGYYMGKYGEDGHGFLHDPKKMPAEPGESSEVSDCTVYRGTLNYGVLLVALYLESQGYEFNMYGTQDVIRKSFGLPPKDID